MAGYFRWDGHDQMEVSIHGGTPKSSILVAFSFMNPPAIKGYNGCGKPPRPAMESIIRTCLGYVERSAAECMLIRKNLGAMEKLYVSSVNHHVFPYNSSINQVLKKGHFLQLC